MHKSCSEHLKPTRVLAHATSSAVANGATNIHFDAGFREWKVATAQPNLLVVSVCQPREPEQYTLEVTETNLLAYDQTLNLVELDL